MFEGRKLIIVNLLKIGSCELKIAIYYIVSGLFVCVCQIR